MRLPSPAPLCALALAGCAEVTPAAPPPAPGVVAPAPAHAPPPSFAGPWGTYRSERFSLSIPLPDGHAWRIDDHAGPWLSATHTLSTSALLVRSWAEDGRASRPRCEERARLWRKLPERSDAEVMQERSLNAPDGFDTKVEVGLQPGKKPGDPISAFAVAFGSHVHRCFAWAFTTTAAGPGADAAIAERLAAMIDGSLAKVVLENELVPRIPRELPQP
jgi:hypothetical protein